MKHILPILSLSGLCLALPSCEKSDAQAAAPAPARTAGAHDWAVWGGSWSRNMVSPEKNPITDFEPGKKVKGKDEIDMATAKNLKWVARLGSQSYGTPVISQGLVLLGTNNENPRDSKYTGDRSVVLALDEKTGEMVWQMPSPKLGTGKVSDWEFLGICSTPAVEGKYVYVPTNRCEVVCLDLNGLKDGNQGFQDEAKYYSNATDKIDKTGEQDADIIWTFDMREECGVFPHNTTSSSVLILEDRLYVTTSNGVDWTHTNIPAPGAPSLICLDKKTGKLLGEEGSEISKRCLHCSWASPAYAEIGGTKQVIFAGGDGFCYGFDLSFKKDEEGFDIINELWRFDANPKEYRFDEAGKARRYADYDGPSEIIATPVVYKNRVYTNVGQDPEHGEGVGMLSCIDATQRGDLSAKPLWTYKEIQRAISTPAIVDDIVYTADYSGRVHAVDANTGAKIWIYDTKGHIWGSPLFIDGKIYIGNEEGELHIISSGKDGGKKEKVIDFPGPLFATPVHANGTLYIMTMSHLYAFGTK